MWLKRTLHAFSNLPGFHTKRKIIVITSDDWGGSRVRSPEARKSLIRAGINMDSNRFDRFDILESNSDLESLFEVLISFKDFKGNNPVITAVTIVANPMFEKIVESDYSEYFFEPFINTLERYPNHDRVYDLYKKGFESRIFIPQLHGREHLNIPLWLKFLKYNNPKVIESFKNEFWFLNNYYLDKQAHNRLDAAFNLSDLSEIKKQKSIINQSAILFKELFNYNANYFTPPSQTYHQSLEKTLIENGINIIDVPLIHKMPLGNGKYTTRLHYLGQRNQFKQIYLTRNVVFEPNISDNDDGVNVCLKGIETAFKYRRPAIISNHRVAFVGGIEPQNRDKGLKSLKRLMSSILKKWPDSEFMSVVDLPFLN